MNKTFSENNIFQMNDISIIDVIPENNIFQINTTSENIFQINTMKTDTRFYKRGLIEDIMFEPCIIETESDATNKISRKLCDHLWLFSFNLMSHINKLNPKLDFNNIKLLNTGNGKGGFIGGIFHFLNNKDIDWIGVDLKNNKNNSNYVKLKNTLDKYKCNYKLLCADITDVSTISHVKKTIENQFNDVNFIYNNIKPSVINDRIMIAVSALALYSLSPNGIFISRILEPPHWDTHFKDYLLLISLIFKKTNIVRFPSCNKKKVQYRYYIVGCSKKKLAYNNIVESRLMHILKKKKDTLTISLNNAEWDAKLNNIKTIYNKCSNPIDDLHDIISKLCI